MLIVSSDITTTGTTNSEGIATFQLDYAFYQISVTASNYFKYQGDFKVTSLDIQTIEALLPKQGITTKYQIQQDPDGNSTSTVNAVVVPGDSNLSKLVLSPSVLSLDNILQGNLPQFVLTIKNTGTVLFLDHTFILFQEPSWQIQLNSFFQLIMPLYFRL